MPRLVDVRYSRPVRLSDLRRAVTGASEAHDWAALWGRTRSAWGLHNVTMLRRWWARQLDRVMGETGILGPSGGAVYMADISPSERQAVIAEMGSGVQPGSPLNSIATEYPDAADVASYNRFADAHRGRQPEPVCGGVLEYETLGGIRVHCGGSYRYRCTKCGTHGFCDGKATHCPWPAADPAPTPSSPPAEPNLCADTAYCRVFVGVDPGRCGSVAIMFAGQRPESDADHGRVLAMSVYDLPQRSRDDGGSELDVPAFVQAVTIALRGQPAGYKVAHVSGLVERPAVGGGMKRGAASIVTQAVNVGAVHAALEAVFIYGLGDVENGGVGWVDGNSLGGHSGWRGELGGVDKGDELSRACDVLCGVPCEDEYLLASTDRAVAVLIAEVGRRRWLGQAVTPKSRGTAKVAKAKKKDRRKVAVARAVAPLTVAKARQRAMALQIPPLAPCMKHNRCCEARLLDWAWRQRPDLPGPPAQTVGIAHAIKSLPQMQHIYKRAVTSKAWTVDLGEGLATMDAEVFDGLEMHGLIQLIPGESAVRYRPTERGLAWARRLRGETT